MSLLLGIFPKYRPIGFKYSGLIFGDYQYGHSVNKYKTNYIPILLCYHTLLSQITIIKCLLFIIVHWMVRLCGGAHEILGIHAPLFPKSGVVESSWGGGVVVCWWIGWVVMERVNGTLWEVVLWWDGCVEVLICNLQTYIDLNWKKIAKYDQIDRLNCVDPDIESCHIIFSKNNCINFKLLIIHLETFEVINSIKL